MQRGKSIEETIANNWRRQQAKDQTQVAWHESSTKNNKQVESLACSDKIDKTSTLKGELCCGYDWDQFTDITDDVERNEPCFEMLANMYKAMSKRSNWNICKLFIRKVKKRQESANNNQGDQGNIDLL